MLENHNYVTCHFYYHWQFRKNTKTKVPSSLSVVIVRAATEMSMSPLMRSPTTPVHVPFGNLKYQFTYRTFCISFYIPEVLKIDI